MDNYKIYKYTSPSGGVYIGQTKHSIEKRSHKNGSAYLVKKNGKYIQPKIAKAIIKYGWNNFKKEILFESLTKEEADEKEREMISYYRSIGTCYNICNGGTKPLDGANDTQVKMYNLNGEFVKQYNSILEATTDLNLDYNAEANISACCLGKKHRAYGYIWRYADSSLEVKPLKRYRERICQFDKHMNYIATYENIEDAHRNTLIGSTSIGNTLNGWSKSAGGYYWKFEGDVKDMIPNAGKKEEKQTKEEKEIVQDNEVKHNNLIRESISLF